MRRRLRDLNDVEILLEQHSDDLTEWERNFLGSLQDWEGQFTNPQEEALENVCGKYDI